MKQSFYNNNNNIIKVGLEYFRIFLLLTLAFMEFYQLDTYFGLHLERWSFERNIAV